MPSVDPLFEGERPAAGGGRSSPPPWVSHTLVPADIPKGDEVSASAERPGYLACLSAAGAQSAPNRSGNAATAAPRGGKKGGGRRGGVSSYRSIFWRTGSFNSAKTRLIPSALRPSSRSSSM